MTRIGLFIFCCLCITAGTFAGTARITVADEGFTPSTTNIRMGDTVLFLWSSGIHEIATVNGIPKDADPLHARLSTEHPIYRFIPTAIGEYPYKTINHISTSISGKIVVGAPNGAVGMYPFLWWQDTVIVNTIHFMHQGVPGDEAPTFTIENADGREVIPKTVMSSRRLDVNVSFLPAGLYTLLIISKGELHRNYIRVKM